MREVERPIDKEKNERRVLPGFMTRAGKGAQRWAGGETWIRGTDASRQQCTVTPVIL